MSLKVHKSSRWIGHNKPRHGVGLRKQDGIQKVRQTGDECSAPKGEPGYPFTWGIRIHDGPHNVQSKATACKD